MLKNIPNKSEMDLIIRKRGEDIKERGREHLVYDCNGKIVELRAATLWYDENCNYVKPESSQSLNCCIS
jgi:hypothetical protein